jgi:hypothetical protein
LPLMPLHHYLVYRLHCVRDGIGLVYVGMTGVYAGQSDRAALEERRRWHSAEPVLWLKGADVNCQRMRVEVTNLSRRIDALAEEARVTAMQCKALGTRIVRGGPWCLRGLSAADRLEIKLVGECQSRAAVYDVGRQLPGGSLADHLAGKRFARANRSAQVVLPVVSATSSRGRRSGRSGASGHDYRRKHGIVYGSKKYLKHKYGHDPADARRRHLQAHRARQ